MRAREGDLIKTKSNVVFDVKGLVHPPNKVIAFPRFIPSPQGTRQGKDALYGKVYSLGDRFKYLQENHPDLIVFDPVFGETLCEVPVDQIAEHYQPTEKLASLHTPKNLSTLENKALRLATALKEKAGIPWSAIGISGSIMAELTNEKSDIDPLVYGIENSHKAYAALQELLKTADSGFKPYRPEELQTLFDFRSKDTQMSFEDFTMVESRKAFQGMFMGTDYFIRFVKEYSETTEQYGDVCYKNSDHAKRGEHVCYKAQDVRNGDLLGDDKFRKVKQFAHQKYKGENRKTEKKWYGYFPEKVEMYDTHQYVKQFGDPYNPVLAGVASYFIPGLGQMISDESSRGLA